MALPLPGGVARTKSKRRVKSAGNDNPHERARHPSWSSMAPPRLAHDERYRGGVDTHRTPAWAQQNRLQGRRGGRGLCRDAAGPWSGDRVASRPPPRGARRGATLVAAVAGGCAFHQERPAPRRMGAPASTGAGEGAGRTGDEAQGACGTPRDGRRRGCSDGDLPCGDADCRDTARGRGGGEVHRCQSPGRAARGGRARQRCRGRCAPAGASRERHARRTATVSVMARRGMQ